MMHKRVRAIMLHTFVPCVRVTSVLPMVRSEKLEGALTSYQSFFEKGSTLLHATKVVSVVARERRRGSVPAAVMHGAVAGGCGGLHFLLAALLALRDALVLADGHAGQPAPLRRCSHFKRPEQSNSGTWPPTRVLRRPSKLFACS